MRVCTCAFRNAHVEIDGSVSMSDLSGKILEFCVQFGFIGALPLLVLNFFVIVVGTLPI